MIKVIYFILMTLIISTTVSLGQKISEEFCEKITKSVVQPLQPSKIYHQIYFEDSCSYDFDLDIKKHLIINVEKYKSKKEVKEEFKNDLEAFLFEGKKINQKPNPEYKKHWDKFYLFKPKGRESFLLLQKGTFYISIITTDGEILEVIEKHFQTIDFNGN